MLYKMTFEITFFLSIKRYDDMLGHFEKQYFQFILCDGDTSFNHVCSMFPRSTHETFAQKLYQTFKDHKRFSKPKLARSDFTICHYAGEVSHVLCLSSNMIETNYNSRKKVECDFYLDGYVYP